MIPLKINNYNHMKNSVNERRRLNSLLHKMLTPKHTIWDEIPNEL
jgi:hypothetical protein